MQFRRLRPVPLVFQRFGLLRQLVVFKATLNIINTLPLTTGERRDKRRGFLRGLLTIDIRQAAHGVAVAAVHSQRLLIVALGGGIIFTRHRHVAQPQHGIAVGIVDAPGLPVEAFRLVRVIRFQRGVALLNRQPVAVYLQQAFPFTATAAVRVHRKRFLELRHRAGTIATLRIGLPQRADGFAVTVIRAYRLLQFRYGFAALSGFHRRQALRSGSERRVGKLLLLFTQLAARGIDAIAFAKHRQVFLQRFYAGVAGRQIFNLLIPESGSRRAPGAGIRHLL